MSVDVRTVQHFRRRLRFEDYGELLSDARHLVELAEARGEAAQELSPDGALVPGTAGVSYLANLNTGQSLRHLALWMDASIDGTPMEPPPWLVRVLARMMKGKLLNEPVMPGFRLSPRGEAHFIPHPSTTPVEGLSALLHAIERLAGTAQRSPRLTQLAAGGAQRR
jgi:hypothetical protein